MNIHSFQNFLGKKLTIEFNHDDEFISDNIHFIDWQKISSSDDDFDQNEVTDIQEYFLNDDVIPMVDHKKLLPIALLGLTHNPSSYQEMSNNGALLIPIGDSGNSQSKFFWCKQDQLIELDSEKSQLKILEVIEQQSSESSSSSTADLNQPPYKDLWESSLKKSQETDYQGSLSDLLSLEKILPSNAEVELAISHVYAHLKDWENAEKYMNLANCSCPFDGKLTLAQSILFLEQEKWSEALAKSVEAKCLFDDADKKELAQCLAIAGIVNAKQGDKQKALAELTEAKQMYTFIAMKIPFFNEVFAQLSSNN